MTDDFYTEWKKKRIIPIEINLPPGEQFVETQGRPRAIASIKALGSPSYKDVNANTEQLLI